MRMVLVVFVCSTNVVIVVEVVGVVVSVELALAVARLRSPRHSIIRRAAGGPPLHFWKR